MAAVNRFVAPLLATHSLPSATAKEDEAEYNKQAQDNTRAQSPSRIGASSRTPGEDTARSNSATCSRVLGR